MFQYDNSALYFFCLSTISFFLIPSWYSILRCVCVAFLIKDEDIGVVARTSAEKAKEDKIKRKAKGLNALKSRGLLINLAVTIIFTVLFVWLAVLVSTDSDVNTFNPFFVLEIDTASDMRAIKRAYHDMALKYHPDRNPNNPAAGAKFMMVTKAYEALTDEVAKANWERYGNPGGIHSAQPLPSFLIDPSNRNLMLMAFFVITVGVIYFCVWSYHVGLSKFGENDVMYDTYSWFHFALSEHTSTKALPEVMAGSAEFRKCNLPSANEKEEIDQIMSQLCVLMVKPKYNLPVCVKGNVLLHAHLLRRTDMLSEKSMDDLNYMLRLSNSLIDAMISVCQHEDYLQTAMNCIDFSQLITQAMWLQDSTLLQLPHFTAEEVKHVEKGKQKGKSISVYRQLPDDQKMDITTFTNQKQDVMSCFKVLPDIAVEHEVLVDDEEGRKVYEGDLCTVRVTITRKNQLKGEPAGLVQAPRFPFPKQEAWWIILGTKEGKIMSIEKVANPHLTFDHNIKFLAPRQGDYEFDLFVKSNAYVGLDQQHTVKLTTLDNSVFPEYNIHPKDAELNDEPTLFEDMLNANVEHDSESDVDDDDDSNNEDEGDEKKKKLDNAGGGADHGKSTAGNNMARLLKAQRQVETGDDDDDEAGK